MLRLDQLEISGFKTFVDPVATDFAGGITAIVGPNGCGKSNFAEAVTWVLGEQSAKSLRSGTMEDVIFSGSDSRKPLGMAEVSLTFQADESIEHAIDGRITIGRRVFRSGESQYRLNDKLVRLKDVKDLLMDTGLGIRAYSVIEQGRIGMILSGKPQERRKLIEEAAGITRYKARKRVAEVKLEEATANLLRLDDIISEVERALRSLKRQANAAVRFKERQAAHRELLDIVLKARAAALEAHLRELRSRLAVETESQADSTAALHKSDAELASGRERLEELGEELSSRHQRLAELAATIEGRQQFIHGSRQTLSEIEERLERGRGLADQRKVEMESHLESLHALGSKHRQLLEERDEALSAVEQDRRRIQEAETELAAAERALEELRSQLMSSMGKINALQNRLHKEQIEAEKANYRRDHVTAELDQRRQEVALAKSNLDEAETRVQGLEGRLSSRHERRQELKGRLDETLRLEKEASERLEKAKDELAVRRERRNVLEELARAEEKRRSTLAEALGKQGIEQPRFLSDEVAVPVGWEGSLDLFLEQLGDAVLLEPERDALTLAEGLAGGRFHGSLIRPGASGAHTPLRSPQAPSDDAVVESLGSALGLDPDLAAALPPAYLVRSTEDAQRLASQHPGVAFISRDRLWAQGGVLHVLGDKARPGALSRQRELAEIERRIAFLDRGMAESEASLTRLVSERTRLAGEVNRLDEELAATRQELAVAQARRQDASDRFDRLAEEHGLLEREGDELAGALQQIGGRQEQLQTDLAAARQHHQQLEERFDAAQSEVETAREKREALRTAGAGREGRLALLEERVDAHGTETRRLTHQRDEARLFLDRFAEEERSLTRRREELERARREAETQLQEALEQRVEAEASTKRGQEVVEEQRGRVRELEKRVADLRAEREEQQSTLQDLRVEEASLRQDAGHLAADYREAFGTELPSELEPPPENVEELEAELEERKRVLEKMGPVNVLAAEEYAEQEERHRFLTEQRADVASSVDQLRKTIRDINQTSSERFSKTFTEVNENFARIFADLFRGGEAEMRLLDEDDPLESGIEIVARPPGKRPQNIMLLSGGEKALGAIALLFALFEAKPSPFCILDEVDAPLDDANILRFVQVLKEMSKKTQFLIITHNKLTMEVAASLYGVTMEEKGVSKLVAVDVEDLHPAESVA